MKNTKKTRKLAVVELLDRKNSGCPLTIVKTRDEYRMIDQIQKGIASQPSISGLFRWDATQVVKDLMSPLRPDSETRMSFLDVVRWFVSPPSPQFVSEEGEEPACPRSRILIDVKLEDVGGAPPGSILVVMDGLPCSGMIDPREGGYSNAVATRELKNRSQDLVDQHKAIFILNHQEEIPPELEGFCPIISHEGPTKRWLEAEIQKSCAIDVRGGAVEIPRIDLDARGRDLVVDELRGLTSSEVREALALANRSNAHMISSGVITPSSREFDLESIRTFKAIALKRSSAMRLVPPVEGGFSVVGGLGPLKGHIETTAEMIRIGASDDGISPANGVLLVGSGGTGKSLIAKAVGSILNRQMVCLDVSACKGSLVGQSESQFRKALEVADQMSPVVLFLDEFEKVWGGSEQANDSGVSSGMLQTWLNWMQDWKDPGVFVIAACNDVRNLPGPVIRSGRFDKVVYVPLPGVKAREEILNIHLRKRGWEHCLDDLDIKGVAEMTRGFSGAELEIIAENSIVNKIMRSGLGRDKHVTTDDLVSAANEVTPTSKTHGEEIESLYNWAVSSGVVIATDEDLDYSFEMGTVVPNKALAKRKLRGATRKSGQESPSNPEISVGDKSLSEGENSEEIY